MFHKKLYIYYKMSLNSLNIKPKCYKVIINLLDSDSAYEAKDFTEDLKLVM